MRERSLTFPAVIAVVVVLGGLMVFAANNDQANAGDTPPQAGVDHWHDAFGIFVCDAYLPELTDQNDPVGIHTHGDGVIHIHPFLSKAAGSNARMDDYFEATGLEASPTELKMPDADGGTGYGPDTDCGGTPAGPIRLLRWDNPDDTEPETITGDFGDQRFTADGVMWALVVAPEGTVVPVPPSTEKLKDLSLLDDYYPTEPNPGTTVLPEGEGSDTTVAGDAEVEGTGTTVAGEGTATTVAGEGTATTAASSDTTTETSTATTAAP